MFKDNCVLRCCWRFIFFTSSQVVFFLCYFLFKQQFAYGCVQMCFAYAYDEVELKCKAKQLILCNDFILILRKGMHLPPDRKQALNNISTKHFFFHIKKEAFCAIAHILHPPSIFCNLHIQMITPQLEGLELGGSFYDHYDCRVKEEEELKQFSFYLKYWTQEPV